MKRLLIGHTLFLMSLCACTAQTVKEAQSQKKIPASTDSNQTKEKPPEGKPEVGETIAIPTNIAGAYLVCAVRKEASAKSLESEIGCLLADKDSGKKLGADPKLSFSSSQPSSVTADPQAATSLYHVIYRVKGESRDAILQTTQSLEAVALYADKTFKVEKIAKVLKPAIELDDYEAPIVREQAIDKDEAGSL